jgi:hypothetical protein
MSIVKSKELAFFNILGRLISTTSNSTNNNGVKINLVDLEDKMSLDKAIISKFLIKLKEDKIFDIIDQDETTMSLHFEKTHEKLAAFVHPKELDNILIEINNFIFKYSTFFDFSRTFPIIIETAQKVSILLQSNPNFNISSIIRTGILKLYNHPHITFFYSKFFFNIAEKIDDCDQPTLENIIYYFFTLPYEENPFITSVFLSQVAIQMELLKKSTTLKAEPITTSKDKNLKVESND